MARPACVASRSWSATRHRCMRPTNRSEEHTSELQSHRDLHSFPTRRSSDLLMRRPEWLVHPNGATGLRGVTIVVGDTAPLHEAYERLFGPAKIHGTDDILTL